MEGDVVYATVLQIVGRLSTRTFAGLPLCRNEEMALNPPSISPSIRLPPSTLSQGTAHRRIQLWDIFDIGSEENKSILETLHTEDATPSCCHLGFV